MTLPPQVALLGIKSRNQNVVKPRYKNSLIFSLLLDYITRITLNSSMQQYKKIVRYLLQSITTIYNNYESECYVM